MNKVLIASPRELDKSVLSFPFLYALNEQFEELEINIIVPENFYNVYASLPFNVKVYELPKHKETLMGIHHYAYNLKDVFNIETFFDFANDFNSSLLGFFFRSKVRIGNREGIKKFLLNHQVKKKSFLSTDKDFISYLESLTGDEVNTFKILGNDKPYVQAKHLDSPYFLIMLDGPQEAEKNLKLWKDFFKGFSDQKFVFWNKDIDRNFYENEEYFKKFIEEFGEENEFILSTDPSIEELVKLIIGSRGVFTDADWASSFCAYFGVAAFFFNKKEHSLNKYRFFKIIPNFVQVNQNKIPFLISTKKDTKGIGNMNEALDYIHTYLDL